MQTTNTLGLEDAKRIAAAAEAEAKRNKWNVVIAVLDDGGNLVYLQRADGTQLGSIEVAIAKGRGAILFKRPTKNFEEMLAAGRLGFLSAPNVLPIEGGLPVTVGGEIVGAVGVSGVQSSQDAQVAKAGVDAVLKEDG
ncbi:MAG: GlcG/HbpS family heme-binding protein [Burkholderiales bacterium]